MRVQDLRGKIIVNKGWILFSTVFVCFLIVSLGVNVSSVCYAANPEYLELTAPEKVLTILEEVVGLDMAEYSAELDLHIQAPFLYYDVLPQEDVKYTLAVSYTHLTLPTKRIV